MNERKSELRSIVLDIVFKRAGVTYAPSQFGHLTAGVAEVLSRNETQQPYSASVFQPEARLSEPDWLLVQEVFWDLVSERVLTPGMNSANSDFPWFRIHSQAESNLASV